MKLTDERVAKALGWKPPEKGQAWRYWESPDGKKVVHGQDLPAYTTSLDAIVAEIEARKDSKGRVLGWGIAFHPHSSGDNSERTHAWVYYGAYSGLEDTGPLALCAALLSYLKEAK